MEIEKIQSEKEKIRFRCLCNNMSIDMVKALDNAETMCVEIFTREFLTNEILAKVHSLITIKKRYTMFAKCTKAT